MISAFGVEHGEISKSAPAKKFQTARDKKPSVKVKAEAQAKKPKPNSPFALPTGRLPWE